MFAFFKDDARQENHSKLSFTAKIITKYSLERFLSICGEKLSKGFLKFWKLISNLNHCLKSYKRAETKYPHKLRSTSAYHSRCSSCKVSSKASIASDFATLLLIKQGENENDAVRNLRLWQATYFSTTNPINKLAMNNRRLLIAAEFHFVHSVENDS